MAHGKSLQLRYITRPAPQIIHATTGRLFGKTPGQYVSPERRARKAAQLADRRAARQRAIANGLGVR